MTESKPHTNTTPSSPARIAQLVGAALAGLLAAGLLAIGGLALWGDAQKDDEGYLSTGSHRFAADTRALASENLDIDLDGVESIVDSSDLGEIRLRVSPQADEPVFVGIAPTAAVSAYLGEVAHTSVTDVDYSPFTASYSDHHGKGRPAPPAHQTIWEASVDGTGTQTLKWDVEDGDWSVVVMNADGSPGVQTDISVGAKAPFLAPVGWGAIGGGALLLAAAAVLALLGIRGPRSGAARAARVSQAPASA